MKSHDIELEKGVLNNMIFYDDACSLGLIHLKRQYFFDKNCQSIFDIIVDMAEKNINVDYPGVAAKMKDSGMIVNYLSTIQDSFENPRKINDSIVRLRNMAYLRGLERTSKEIDDLIKCENDIDQITEKAESILFDAIGKKEIVDYKTLSKSITPMLNQIEDRMKGNTGLKTEIESLDELLIGMSGGTLVVMAARPSMGKSALAASILFNIAKKGITGGLFSFEMRAESVVERYIADKADVSYYNIRAGKLEELEMKKIIESIDEISDKKICIDDSGGCTVDELCQKIKLMKRRNKIGIAIIDHLSYISAGDKENRNQQIEYILKKIKSVSKEINIPIILLSQLSRRVEERPNKIPILSDLRDSGSIEQDADIILMLYRDEYYNKETPRKNILDVFVRKNRDGMTGSTELLFLRNRMRFIDLKKQKQMMDGI